MSVKEQLFCAKDGCTENLTEASMNDIIMHDIEVHGDDFLRGCLTKSDVDLVGEPPRYLGGSSDAPADVLEALKANPGMVYVVRGMQAMYAHYGDNVMFCFVGDFTDMGDEEVNAFLQTSLKKVQDAAQVE